MRFIPWEKLQAKDGQSLVEYALITFLVAVAVVGSLSLFGVSVLAYFNRIAAVIPV
jgi:Flp pilus assembly pilin Flp